jgi:hypothetical protein
MSLLKFIDNELKRMDEDDRTLPEDYHLYDSDGYSPELQHELAEERGKRQFGGESHEDELYRAKFRGDVDDIEYEVVESNKRGKYMDLSNTVDYLSAIHSERGFLDAEQVAKAERGKTKPIKAKVPTDGRDVEDIKAEGQGIPPSSLGK